MQILSAFAPITISGADAKSFLQGQLSNDLNLLTPQQALLASCNSAQGRALAIVTLIERPDSLLAIVPKTMTSLFIARLRKYILRSKVAITDSSDQLQCVAATTKSLGKSLPAIPSSIGAHIQSGQTSILRWWDSDHPRFLVIQPKSTSSDHTNVDADSTWLLDDIRAGIPHVLVPTHEAFVAQMLNLDALNGISFTKGCYTGQEIIARAHYRGAVKRRMFRLSGACPPPAPAARIVAADGSHAGDVVIAAATDAGCELLAVLSLNHVGSALRLDSNANVPLKMESLPYTIPSLA
ncbi:MAG TPA: hypothetical protein VHL14_12070 [Steroidobacteraceae bacterium]|nr:hypothetical protein [Steroidobacteraceae bacterium]